VCVTSLDILETELVVGCSIDHDGDGRVYLFQHVGSEFIEVDSFGYEVPQLGFGNAVSISEEILVVGATSVAYGRGASFIFARTDSGHFTGYMQVEVPGLSENDAFGKDVDVLCPKVGESCMALVSRHLDDTFGKQLGSATLIKLTGAMNINPTHCPTVSPLTSKPTFNPTDFPSHSPSTSTPSSHPTNTPTNIPTLEPTLSEPTQYPTIAPTVSTPTMDPSTSTPTAIPTGSPSTSEPTHIPTKGPSVSTP